MERQQEMEIDLKELFFVLWDKVIIILAATVVTAIAAALITYFIITPIYVSTSSVYVMNRQNSESTLTTSDLSAATQLTNDYEEMIKSNVVLNEVIEQVGLDATTEALADIISVYNPTDTRFLEISVSHSDPLLARDIADAVTEISAERIVELMGVEEVNIVDQANLPLEPSSPSMLRNVAIAAVAGFVIACGIVLAVYMLNDKIRTTADVERYLELSVLGVIPDIPDQQTSKRRKKSRKGSKS